MLASSVGAAGAAVSIVSSAAIPLSARLFWVRVCVYKIESGGGLTAEGEAHTTKPSSKFVVVARSVSF